MADDPDLYRFADDGPPPARSRPVPLPNNEPHELAPPPTGGRDPFLPVLGGVAVAWVGLGLAAEQWPEAGLLLAVAGGLVYAGGKLYLQLMLSRGDPRHGLLSYYSPRYRAFRRERNIALSVRPMVLGGAGLLMVLTGVVLFLKHAIRAAVQ